MAHDEQTKQQARWIYEAIIALSHATEDEQQALSDIFHVEGFGGDEFFINSFPDAQRLADDKLAWLRSQREEGLR